MRQLRLATTWVAAYLFYLAVTVVLAPTLVFGGFGGSDFPNALVFANWIEPAWPRMPFWFPYQGGGVSPSSGYAIFPMWVIAGIARTGLGVETAARLALVLIIPFGALGVGAYARALGLRTSAALLAGLFSLLPPAAWNLLIRIGFVSNTFAAAFAPWAAAAITVYASHPRGRLGRLGVVWAVGAIIMSSATLLMHPVVGALPLVLGALTAAGRRSRVFARVVAVGLVTAACVAGMLMTFILYSRAANTDGTNTFTPDDLRTQHIDPLVLLGLAERSPSSGLLDGMSLTPFLLVLGAGGAIVAARRRQLRPLLVATLLCALYLFSYDIQGMAVGSSGPLSPLFGNRGVLIFFLVGASVLAAAVIDRILAIARPQSFLLAALIIVGSLVALEGPSYGPHGPDDRAFLRDIAVAELLHGHDPRISPVSIGSRDSVTVASLLDPERRSDVSPTLGSDLKGLPLETSARVLNLYTYQLSLVHASWADETEALYLDDTYRADPSELATWYGFRRILLQPRDHPERLAAAGWSVGAPSPSSFLRYADPPVGPELAAFRRTGVVLHIGSVRNETYRNALRMSNTGGLPFALAWIVRGPACVDDMPAGELERFDAVMLDDQCVRDRPSAERRLTDYVQAGGRLFIETGRQYSMYYDTASAPAFLPMDSLRWRAVGSASPAIAPGPPIDATGIDATKFASLTYESGPWTSSVAGGALRSWASPVLVADGVAVVAAGKLGQGRVVWSGMNYSTHVRLKSNLEEARMYARLMNWLLDGRHTDPVEIGPRALREDGADLQVPGDGWLLWREPATFASTSSGGALFSAGPGFLLTPVRKGVETVIQRPTTAMRLASWVGAIASLLVVTWATLGVWYGGAADPAALFGLVWRRLRQRFAHTLTGSDE